MNTFRSIYLKIKNPLFSSLISLLLLMGFFYGIELYEMENIFYLISFHVLFFILLFVLYMSSELEDTLEIKNTYAKMFMIKDIFVVIDRKPSNVGALYPTSPVRIKLLSRGETVEAKGICEDKFVIHAKYLGSTYILLLDPKDVGRMCN